MKNEGYKRNGEKIVNRIVYLFELDSVRNSTKEIEKGQRALFREIVLNGNTVVLSLNQITDSEAFLNLMREEEAYENIMRLFELGALKIAVYKKNENDKRTAFQYIKETVGKCLDESKQIFLFSGLPLSLKNDKELLENIKIALENSDVAKLRERLNRKKQEYEEATDDSVKENIEQECEKILFVIRYVKLLLTLGIEEIGYNPPNENQKTNLVYYIDKIISTWKQIKDNPTFSFVNFNLENRDLFIQLVNQSIALVEEIKEEMQNTQDKKDTIQNRSNWYKEIQSKNNDEELTAMAMSIIDLCYNYTVEDSIGKVLKRYSNDEEFINEFSRQLYNYINDYYKNDHDFSIEPIKEYKEFVKSNISWDTAVRIVEATKRQKEVSEDASRFIKEKSEEKVGSKEVSNSQKLKIEKKRWNYIIIRNMVKKFMVTVVYIVLFCIAQWIMGQLEGIVSGTHVLNGLLYDIFAIVLFGILGSVVAEVTHLPDILESIKNIYRGMIDCCRIMIETFRSKEKKERSERWMLHLKKYEQLQKEHPEYFASSKLINIELDKDKIIEYQNKTGKKIGVVYESEYSMVVVDLIKNADHTYYTYERMIPTVKKGAVVVLATYKGKIILLNQYRHALREYQYAFPRGFGEEGISEEENVCKEMKEELSANVNKIEKIGEVIADSGLTSNKVSVFKCEIEQYAIKDGYEGIKEVLLLEKDEFEKWIQDGKITDGFTLAAYSLDNARSSSII